MKGNLLADCCIICIINVCIVISKEKQEEKEQAKFGDDLVSLYREIDCQTPDSSANTWLSTHVPDYPNLVPKHSRRMALDGIALHDRLASSECCTPGVCWAMNDIP